MKKTFFTTLLVLTGFGLTMNAQSLATFEDGANDVLIFSDYATSGDPYWFDSGLFVEGGLPQVGANPSKGGINTSDKCLLAINVANANWWGNFCVLGTSTPVTITENNRYLHIKVYRSIQPKNFRIGFNDREEANEVFQGTVPNDGQWEAVVCDLGAKFMGQQLQYLHFIFSTNWSDPRDGWGVATYGFDDIALSNSPIPPSITLVDGNGLSIGFESQSETDQWVDDIDVLNESNTYSIIDNPFTTSQLNGGGKVFQFNKSADASWWQGARFNFNGIMEVGGDYPNYIHVLVYIPSAALQAEDMGIEVQLCAKDHLGNENTEIFTVWDTEVDGWVDLVMEITQLNYLKELTVRYDLRKDDEDNYINSPAGIYYLDEIVFNKDANPRAIEASVPVTGAASFARIKMLDGAIDISTEKTAAIALYNVAGQLVHTVNAVNNTVIPVNKGVYIVEIVAAGGEKQIEKVLVK